MTTDRDISGASHAFVQAVVKVSGATLCRCTTCNRNDIAMADMAIYSWKEFAGMFTGICAKCLAKED